MWYFCFVSMSKYRIIAVTAFVAIALVSGAIVYTHKQSSDVAASTSQKPVVSANSLCNELDHITTQNFGNLSQLQVDGKNYQCRVGVDRSKTPLYLTRIQYTLEGNQDASQTRESLTAQADAWLQAAGWTKSNKQIGIFTYDYVLASNHDIYAAVHVLNPQYGLIHFETAINDSYVPKNPDNTEPKDINPTNRVERLEP
jgi:hypothetical protein